MSPWKSFAFFLVLRHFVEFRRFLNEFACLLFFS